MELKCPENKLKKLMVKATDNVERCPTFLEPCDQQQQALGEWSKDHAIKQAMDIHIGNPKLHTPKKDSGRDLPGIDSLVYCESNALDHAATEASQHRVPKKTHWQLGGGASNEQSDLSPCTQHTTWIRKLSVQSLYATGTGVNTDECAHMFISGSVGVGGGDVSGSVVVVGVGVGGVGGVGDGDVSGSVVGDVSGSVVVGGVGDGDVSGSVVGDVSGSVVVGGVGVGDGGVGDGDISGSVVVVGGVGGVGDGGVGDGDVSGSVVVGVGDVSGSVVVGVDVSGSVVVGVGDVSGSVVVGVGDVSGSVVVGDVSGSVVVGVGDKYTPN
uniref:Uncharacterized protein n=1 Tax=Timema monikensis TaxID=170555 RepID=A0A7R9HJ37_9NEOP|nr:unnamed protein product [Timema monikensis]